LLEDETILPWIDRARDRPNPLTRDAADTVVSMGQAASPVTAHPGRLLAVLAFGGGAYAMLQSLVVPALPTLQRDLNTTPSGVAWIFTAYLLAASVATPIAGRLGDMFGKKRTLVVVLAGLAAGTLLAAVATTLPVMIVARTIQGLGGAIFPLAFGIVRDEFPRERVAGGIALISGLLGVGGGLGIVLAGPILAHLDYHWLFWIPFVVIAATVVATMLIIPESPVRAPGNVDWTGAVLLSLWLVCLLVAISEASSWGWLSARTLGLIGVGVVVAVVWIWAETRSPSPLVDMRMMQLRGVWTTNLAGFLLGIGMYSSFVLIPQFVQTPVSNGYGFGSSVTQAGLFLIPSTLAMMVASPLGGRLSGRFGSKVPLVLGSIITMLAFVLLAVAHTEHWQVYLSSLLLGTGIGFAFASMANLIVEAVRPDQTGVATGMNTVMRTIGGAIGAQIVASILAANVLADGYPKEAGYTVSLVLMAVALAAGIVASLAVPGRQPHRVHTVTLGDAQPSTEQAGA
jgi:EmrB/QacA subfamily drug resistance transporter